jgi:transposase
MPTPLPFPLRQQIVQRHQQGETLGAIAHDLHVPPATVRDWWHRFRDQGEAGLQTHYDRCGPKEPKAGPVLHQAALTMKREHPTWGAGLIRLALAEPFAGQRLPHPRTLQRWFRAAGLQPLRAQRPPMERQRGKEPHAVWEIDAKERLRLADGSGTSVLTVTDEASGALLGATPFPPVSLESGLPERGAASAAGAVRTVGAAGPHPGR